MRDARTVKLEPVHSTTAAAAAAAAAAAITTSTTSITSSSSSSSRPELEGLRGAVLSRREWHRPCRQCKRILMPAEKVRGGGTGRLCFSFCCHHRIRRCQLRRGGAQGGANDWIGLRSVLVPVLADNAVLKRGGERKCCRATGRGQGQAIREAGHLVRHFDHRASEASGDELGA
jgi:hypothetical protein